MNRIRIGLIAVVALLGAQAAVSGNAFVTAYMDFDSRDTRKNVSPDEQPMTQFLKTTRELAALKTDRLMFDANTDALALQNNEAKIKAKQTADKKRWFMFEFDQKHEGVGDASALPFGDQVEYKINAMNYNLRFGDKRRVPFQLYFADLKSKDEPEKENKTKLLDPTHGFAMQFPIGAVWKGRDDTGGLCNFTELKGYCMVGGDLTLRGVKLNETDDAGTVKETTIFGASAGLRASALFPITTFGSDDQVGHLGIAIGARYYYHNTNKHDLLFENVTDPNGKVVDFKKGFAALTAESEFDIYNHFKIRLEYFRPLSNVDQLGNVFKASIVVEPEKTN